VRFYEIPEEAGGKRYRAEMVGDILAIDLKQQLEDDGASSDADKPQRAVAAWAARDEPATKEGVVSEGELYRLQRAIERLMAGHREALGVIDQEVEDQEVEDQEFSAQETLAEVQDILSGALEDAQSILDGEEGRA
jgi:hypothetical protein